MAPQLPFGRRLDMAAPEHTQPRCQLFAHAPRQRSYLPAELELGKVMADTVKGATALARGTMDEADQRPLLKK